VAFFFGVLLFFVAYFFGSLSHGLVLFSIAAVFGVFILSSGMMRGTGMVYGEWIHLRNLMTGKKYKIRPTDITHISLKKADTGYGFSRLISAGQRIKCTTVTFKVRNKAVTLEFFNNKHWQFGDEIAIADVFWIARDEARKK